MNTFQINAILSGDVACGKIFKGCLARDQFVNEKILEPSCYVYNTEDSTKSGEHWLAVFFDSEGHCEFFDSYGSVPYNDDVMDKLMLFDNDF